MRDQQSSDTSIALDANTDVQQEADKPAVKWRYLFGFLAWTVLNAIAFYMTASIMIPQRLKASAWPTLTPPSAPSTRPAQSCPSSTPCSSAPSPTGLVPASAAYPVDPRRRSAVRRGHLGHQPADFRSDHRHRYCIGLIGLNAVQAPLLTIISDRVPEDFRATASAAVGGGGVAGQAIGMLIASLFINHVEIGFIVAAVFALLSGVLSIIIFPREPSNVDMPREETSVGQILIHTLTPPTKGASDFWKAFICRTCLIVAYQMITSYQLYILQDHIGLSNTDAAKAISVMAIITMIVSFIAAIISGPLSDAIKRRKPPILVACILYAIGIAMPWFIPSVAGMFLFAGIAGFGYGMYSAVDQALNVDVLPNKKDAGKDLGILNIATCAGQAIGSFVTSSIVTMTHNYNLVFPTAIVIALCAGASVLTIKRIK